ncbi:hypothetical protein RRG08_017335 [Elysia crispata]|uniref:BUD13 homolog n=1 Tax=Elysia crispata TaxID=231223 RepID=A0AAE1CKB3_9GAST|nr:hypothetical protein RRG08_017335 [Elysia crispata]
MAALSKAEYLKRYMSKDKLPKDEKKKKRKKMKPPTNSRLQIIDDDVDFKRKDRGGAAELEDEEEAPTVAEVVDERPKHVQQLEAYRKSNRWKTLGQEEDDESISADYGVIRKSSPHTKGLQPRKKRHDSSDSDQEVAKRKRHDSSSESDLSPSRRGLNKKVNPEEMSRRVRKRHDTDSDLDNSPPKKRDSKRQEDSNQSPQRPSSSLSLSLSAKTNSSSHNSKTLSESQQSSKTKTNHYLPTTSRLGRHDSDSDQSPVRERKGGSDSDQSPARRRKAGSDSDQSPIRRRKAGSDSDQSPVRRRKAGSDSDQSPPRKRKKASNFKELTSRKRHDSDSDPSPPRKNRPQQSPPRDKRRETDSDSRKRSRKSRFEDNEMEDERLQKATKTLGGAKAGLSSAREMKEEAKKLKEKEERSFQNIDEATLGRNAKTVVRDKHTGKRKNLQAESEKAAEEEKKKEEQREKYAAWGKGVKQRQDKEAKLQDQIHEAMKPLARYSDDADLDAMRRLEERAEDPMLAFIQKRRKKEEEKAGVKKKKELPRYKGPAPPPNRFNLMPGYRWDGVDRSNGFEKKIFAHRANKTAIKEMAYKWSTEDM